MSRSISDRPKKKTMTRMKNGQRPILNYFHISDKDQEWSHNKIKSKTRLRLRPRPRQGPRANKLDQNFIISANQKGLY